MKSFKTKMKVLAAAVAVAAAAPAAATITTTNATTSELFLTVWSSSLGGGTSYTRDLGVTINNFLPTSANVQFGSTNGGTEAWNNVTGLGSTVAATAGSVVAAGYTLNFQNDNVLLNSGLLTAADTVWMVGAERSSAVSPILLSTVSAGTYATATTSSVGFNPTNIDNVFVTAVNGLGTHPGTAATNGSSLFSGSTTAVTFGGATAFGSAWGGNVNFTDTAGLGTAMQFLAFNGAGGLTVNQYANGTAQWLLDANGNLSYSVPNVAAVPEPGTWAMLVAGLMMVGGIARRRTSV